MKASQSPLYQLGYAYVMEELPVSAPELNDTLISCLFSYIKGDTCYENCAQVFVNLIGTRRPVDKVRAILITSDKPLPDVGFESSIDQPREKRKIRTWSQIEDTRLLAGITKYGLDDWASVSRFVGSGRSRAQCSQRWSRGLNPQISKVFWSPYEDSLLLKLVDKYGSKAWTKIANEFGNRSDAQCRYHYNTLERRKNKIHATLRRKCVTPPEIRRRLPSLAETLQSAELSM